MRRAMLILAAVAAAAPPAAAWSPRKRDAEPPARACPEVGEGYVRLPGTDTCVRLGGFVRVEASRQGGSR